MNTNKIHLKLKQIKYYLEKDHLLGSGKFLFTKFHFQTKIT